MINEAKNNRRILGLQRRSGLILARALGPNGTKGRGLRNETTDPSGFTSAEIRLEQKAEESTAETRKLRALATLLAESGQGPFGRNRSGSRGGMRGRANFRDSILRRPLPLSRFNYFMSRVRASRILVRGLES